MLVNPDLTLKELNIVEFKSLSFLPATTCPNDVCSRCCQYIVFRDDISPNTSPPESIARQLDKDMNQYSTSQALKKKLGLDKDKLKLPTPAGLNLYQQIAARYVGIGSLFPTKTTVNITNRRRNKRKR